MALGNCAKIIQSFYVKKQCFSQCFNEKNVLIISAWFLSFLNLEKRQFCGEITKQNFYEYYYDYYDEDNKIAIHMVFDGFYYVTIYPYGTIITHKVYNDDETNDSNKYYQYLSSGIVYQNIADYLVSAQ